MNLHSVARGAISAVNPDKPATFYASIGNTVDDAGKQTPAYAAGVPVTVQVQPANSGQIRQAERLNIQGELRSVFMFGDTQGVVRPLQRGGDKLTFSPFASSPVRTWLTVESASPWDVEQGGWSRILVALQDYD